MTFLPFVFAFKTDIYCFKILGPQHCQLHYFPYDQVGRSEGLPSEVIPDYEKDEEFLKKVHHVLLEVSFQEIIKMFI